LLRMPVFLFVVFFLIHSVHVFPSIVAISHMVSSLTPCPSWAICSDHNVVGFAWILSLVFSLCGFFHSFCSRCASLPLHRKLDLVLWCSNSSINVRSP
jgi:hypothetical protein